jgi:hypothetical protein
MSSVLVSSEFFELPKGAFVIATDSVNASIGLEWYELWL